MVVWQSEMILKNLNPSWKQFSIPLATLCNGELDRPLMIRCYDWDKNSDDDLIGRIFTDPSQLVRETKLN